jgi:hypothetical protein
MSGLTASNLLLYVVWGQSPAQGVPRKGQYSIDTDMLQLSLPTIEAVAMPGKKCERESHRERPGLSFATALRSNAHQQQRPHPPSVEQACPISLEV